MRKPKPDPLFEVRLINRRGQEIAQALQSDILPIQSNRSKPQREFVQSAKGNFWSYVAAVARLTDTQIKRLAAALAAKYADDKSWGDPEGMERIIRQHGFTVPVDDCVLVTHAPVATTANFLDRSAPPDN